jgi:prepilin-type N-terminal cleavage/methylation domain-containing protein
MIVDRSFPARRPERRRSRRRAGFTLVELMIALVMGLIVALAAISLAKTATTTFFEQARISGVEAHVRSASERLRNDLSRAAYMSTPNIQLDPRVAKVPGAAGAPYRIPALQYLQGIAVTPATTIRSHARSVANAMTPHDVFISGNLTSDDVYRGMWITEGSGCGGAGGAQIRLNGAADPAVRRLYNGETTAANRQAMTQLVFMPGMRMNPQVTGVKYAVQVMDVRGCFHYMSICAVTQSTEADSVVLELAGTGTQSILTPAATLGDVCGANLMEEVAVAPIQRVRWYLGVETEASRNDPVLDGPLVSTNKFNLYRQLLTEAGNPAVTVGPPEMIAEYAIDLKLGFLIDSSIPGAPNTTNLDFEAADADLEPWVNRDAIFTTANVGPQRVRSVRYRLAFRTPIADRRTDLGMPSPPPYIARYAMGNTTWARVRTVISEVALLNQGKAVY